MTETLQARHRHGYARRFEIALAAALVLHALAIVLVPPRPGKLALPRIAPDPILVEDIPPDPEVRVVMPQEVARPGTPLLTTDLVVDSDPAVPPLPEPAAPATIAAEPTSPVPRFVFRESPPKLIKSVEPVYPRLARESGAEGTVVLDLRIGDTGRVMDARVVRSDTIALLEEAARAAALQWLFTPGRQRDRAVDCVVRVTILFRMP